MRPHAESDPEIILIDTDGLEDIARVRAIKRTAAGGLLGALLSRVLANYHQRRSEQTGIIMPYRPQADATLEALRDHEAATVPLPRSWYRPPISGPGVPHRRLRPR